MKNFSLIIVVSVFLLLGLFFCLYCWIAPNISGDKKKKRTITCAFI
jgi:ABC-type multidrug transport system permease subunit